MSLNNTNTMKKNSGFTIVELLIVIVVIGILAAITIVAYNGVQARANNTKLDTIAKEIADKAEVYAADNDGKYPLATADFATPAGSTYILSSGASGAIVADGSPAAGKIEVKYCASNAGIKVTAWDYVTKEKSTKARTAGTCV